MTGTLVPFWCKKLKHPHPGQSQLSGRNFGAGRLAFPTVMLPSPTFFCLRLRGIGADEPWWLFRRCSARRSSGVVRDRSGLLSRCLARTRDRLSLWCQDSGTFTDAAAPTPSPVRATVAILDLGLTGEAYHNGTTFPHAVLILGSAATPTRTIVAEGVRIG